MQILASKANTETQIRQRLSDGSDREEIAVTRYTVKVAQDDVVYTLVFDSQPTDTQITEAFNAGIAEASNEPTDLILLLNQKIKEQADNVELLITMQLEKEGII